MSIELISGRPGHGKSLLAIHYLTVAIQQGLPVASNVNLMPGWERTVARREWVYWFRWKARRDFLRRAQTHFHFTEDREELFSIQLAGAGENRGLMVLDEGASWLNSRSWSAKDRQETISFFSQHRKKGWKVLLIAQHPEMLDKQVRDLVEVYTECRKLRELVKVWGVIKIFPSRLFIGVTVDARHQREILRRKWYWANWRRKLYDTMATTSLVGDAANAEDGIVLPSPPEERQNASTGRDASGAGGADRAGEPTRPTGIDVEDVSGLKEESWKPDPGEVPPDAFVAPSTKRGAGRV